LVVHFDCHHAVGGTDFHRIAVHSFDLTARHTIAELRHIQTAELTAAELTAAALKIAALILSVVLKISIWRVLILKITRRKTAGSRSDILRVPARRVAVECILYGALPNKICRRVLRLRLRVGHAAKKSCARRDERQDNGAANDNG